MKLVGREFNSQEYIILFYFSFDFLEKSNWGSCSCILHRDVPDLRALVTALKGFTSDYRFHHPKILKGLLS